MDIRARLLLAFTPLLALLVGTLIALQLSQREAQAALERQAEALATYESSQALALSILQAHDIVGDMIKGGAGVDSSPLTPLRRQIKGLLAQQADGAEAAAITGLYAELQTAHDTMLTSLGRGDRIMAEAMYHSPTSDRLIAAILRQSEQTKAARRDELNAATATLQESTRATLERAALSTVVGVSATLALAWILVGQVVRPLNRLTADAERYAADDHGGTLSPGGDTAQVRRLRDAFQRLLDANQARQQRVQTALSELEQRVAHEERLRATVEALSVPVIPLQADTLLLPLIGHLDEGRSARLTTGLLAAIQQRRARALVLDLTGLANLNPTTAGLLMRTAEAARLLGCRVTLVGVRADQALTLAGSDLTSSSISTARDIPAVLGHGH